MRRTLAAIACVGLVACESLEPRVPADRPTILIDAPIDGDEVEINATFSLTGVVRAPAGGTLRDARIVLSGAANEERTVPLSGRNAELNEELTVARDRFAGVDGRPIDLVVVATAIVGTQIVDSEPVGRTLTLVDRTPPQVSLRLTPGLGRDGDFDERYAAGMPFVLEVDAEDRIGGVHRIRLEAPAHLGGAREVTFSGEPVVSTAFSFEPAARDDITLSVFVDDVAQRPNSTGQAVRVQVGEGPLDTEPPQVELVRPHVLACGRTSTVALVARDSGVGVDRVLFTAPQSEAVYFAPSARATFAVTATVVAPRSGTIELSASAVDAVGNTSSATTARYTIADTLPPSLDRADVLAAAIAPGEDLDVALTAMDACTDLDVFEIAFNDARGVQRTGTVPLGAPSVDATVFVPVPPDLCALEPIALSPRVRDATGLVTTGFSTVLPGEDRTRPTIQVNTLVPSGGLEPGQILSADVVLFDPQSGVRTATITVRGQDLGVANPLFVQVVDFAVANCDDVMPQVAAVRNLIPADIPFNGPTAALIIDVVAEDGAGLVNTAQASVPLTSSQPPEVRFLAPPAGLAYAPGASETVEVFVADAGHPVDTLSLSVRGPATLQGAASSTVAVLARSATVAFTLTVDANAPADADVELIATAYDGATPPNVAQARRALRTCGSASIASVSPALGPVAGDQIVTLVGDGFGPQMTVAIGASSLVDVTVASATVATARIPAGTYLAGTNDVTVACDGAATSATLADGYRFVAPPVVTLIQPEPGLVVAPGADLHVAMSARADGVQLALLELAGPASVQKALSAPFDVFDAQLPAPQSPGTVTITGSATDDLGQTSIAQRLVSVEVPQPVSLELLTSSSTVATGATVGVHVLVTLTDGTVVDRTPQASVTVTSTAASVVDSSRLVTVSPGEVTINATLGALATSSSIVVVDDALEFVHPPLFMSFPAGASAEVEVHRFSLGNRTDVTSQVTLSSDDPAVVDVVQGLLVATGVGDATITAALSSTMTDTLHVRVRRDLDVESGEVFALPNNQAFASGRIDGRVEAHWTSTGVTAFRSNATGSGVLVINGAFVAHGRPGGPADGGRGGFGGGGGGARSGSPGGVGGDGVPPGDSTASNPAPMSPAGSGGGFGTGGQGARVEATSAGAGGGALGRGGDGGGIVVAFGGAMSTVVGSGGGGGGHGAGGGGAGSSVTFTWSRVVLDGVLDLRGAPGGSANSGTPGGGGAGGFARFWNELEGSGEVIVAGGPGGSGSISGGGGGAAGRMVLLLGTPDSAAHLVRVHYRGGRAGEGPLPGEAGAAGGTYRSSF
ncbi:MAG: IPT/TIG domain-containing protein [Deltaproteobacteria bacterium]